MKVNTIMKCDLVQLTSFFFPLPSLDGTIRQKTRKDRIDLNNTIGQFYLMEFIDYTTSNIY